MKPDSVTVSIDSLKLHGFSKLDCQRFRDSFERTFHELASQETRWSKNNSRVIRQVSLPVLSVTEHTSPYKIGREAATLLWRNLFHE